MLELHQDAIDGGQSDFGAFGDEDSQNVLGRQVTLLRTLKDLENLDARQGGLQAQALDFFRVGHGRVRTGKQGATRR